MAQKKIKKFASLYDLRERCRAGDVAAQQCCIGLLHNLGCEHLAATRNQTKWENYYAGIEQYIMSLVGEYGQSEDKAEREVLAELNNVRDCCDDVELV